MCCTFLTHFIVICVLSARASIQLALFAMGEFFDRRKKKMPPPFTRITLNSCCFTSCMEGREICQPCKGGEKSQQHCCNLSLTSVRYSLGPRIPLSAKHWPYSLHIESVASVRNEVEWQCMLIKNISNSIFFAKNILGRLSNSQRSCDRRRGHRGCICGVWRWGDKIWNRRRRI